MTKKTTALFLSILIIIMPFLGFPTAVKTYFYVITGLLLLALVELVSIRHCDRCGSLVGQDDEVEDEAEYTEQGPEGDTNNYADATDRSSATEGGDGIYQDERGEYFERR